MVGSLIFKFTPLQVSKLPYFDVYILIDSLFNGCVRCTSSVDLGNAFTARLARGLLSRRNQRGPTARTFLPKNDISQLL